MPVVVVGVGSRVGKYNTPGGRTHEATNRYATTGTYLVGPSSLTPLHAAVCDVDLRVRGAFPSDQEFHEFHEIQSGLCGPGK